MEIVFTSILASILSSVIVSIVLPKILLISLKKRLIDPINDRKIHSVPASRLGGMSFFPAVFIALSSAFAITHLCLGGSSFASTFEDNLPLFFTSLFIVYLTGLFDDIIGLGYREKFFIQVLSALIFVLMGTCFDTIHGFRDGVPLLVFPQYISIPFTVLLIMFITNSINLIDGIDGLASMLAIAAFLVYGVLFILAGRGAEASVCMAMMGALTPFWFNNVYGVRPRLNSKIFMGDSGALVVGSVLSVMAIRLWNIDLAATDGLDTNLLHIMAFTMLLVPCLDVLRVILHRYKCKKPLFMPDKNHIHHKIMAFGVTPRRALLCIVGIQLAFLFLNLMLYTSVNIISIAIIDVVLWTFMHVAISYALRKNNLAYGN